MKTSAIICEFNPLHSGHKRLIDFAKGVSDKVICIMSGNFTQRGLPACADKYSRARHAVLAGADLVVELPTIFATSSAENFAFGGVAIAKQLQCDYLVFGSECGDIEKIKQCAKLLNDKHTNDKIKAIMATGVSYPTAVSQATQNDLLTKPNNTLAIEYVRAIEKLGVNITPITISREDNYGEVTAKHFASSTALRADKTLFEKYSYAYVQTDVDNEVEMRYKQYAPLALSTMTAQSLSNVEGVTEGIQNRFVCSDKSNGYDVMLEQIKTKRFTHAKLQRIVLSAILGVTADLAKQAKTTAPNTLPLAVTQNSLCLLSLTNGQTDPITKTADNLYLALSGKQPPQKLQKIDR